jgi:glycosyltransferase involved in cell wall biosynthesis
MRRAVHSVIDQVYPGPVNVIIVFDACPIDVPRIALPPNRSIRGVANARSRGLAGARNTGILQAATDYVAFLDDDDAWLPGKLVAQMNAFLAAPSAVLVGSAMQVNDGVRTFVRTVPVDKVTHGGLLRDRMPGLHSSSFVLRRDRLLGDLGLIDEELPRSYGEDYDLLLRATSLGEVIVVNRPLVTVMWAGQSYFFGHWNDYGVALEYLLHKHPDFATSRRAIGRIEAQIAYAYASAGRRSEGAAWARRSIRHDPTRAKAYLAHAIAWRMISSQRVTGIVQRMGKGI